MRADEARQPLGAAVDQRTEQAMAPTNQGELRKLPVEWLPVSSGARIAMDSGTENLDATARVVRRIVTFTQNGGVIHLIVAGVNVGAQSYWNALATMLMHTRGALVMTNMEIRIRDRASGKALYEARARIAKDAPVTSPLSTTILIGNDFAAVVDNMARNLAEGRMHHIQAVAVRI